MSFKNWQTIKTRYCEHAKCSVGLEALVIYPADIMPSEEPRVVAHRCALGTQCNLVDKPSCVWAGTNPNYDPFAED